MTPELFNMIGALLLLLVGVALITFGTHRAKDKQYPEDADGAMMIVGLILTILGSCLLLACGPKSVIHSLGVVGEVLGRNKCPKGYPSVGH